MKIVFATGNLAKLREAQEILGGDYELATPADMGVVEEIPETGKTLKENSIQKAQYIKDHCNINCFADDTGLEVEILKGAPGVYSARYAGENHDFQANMEKLLSEMALHEKEASMIREYGLATPHATRRARFRTVITLVLDGHWQFFDGTVEGIISREKTGTNGFGYDPVFIPDFIPGKEGELVPNVERISMAQLSDDEKNMISHRGRALRAMADFIHAL